MLTKANGELGESYYTMVYSLISKLTLMYIR